MKTRRLATAFEMGSTESISAHAAGFVSRMIVKRDGLCSARVSHPLHSRMLLESDARLTSRWQFITEVLATISAVHIQCRRTLRMSKCKACNGTFAAILFSTRHSPESGGDQSPYTTLTTCSSRSYCLARSVCKSWARIGSKALQARVYRAQPYSIYKVYHSRELGDDEAYLQAFRGPTPFSVEVRKAMS